jgi:outer membrane protein TolC
LAICRSQIFIDPVEALKLLTTRLRPGRHWRVDAAAGLALLCVLFLQPSASALTLDEAVAAALAWHEDIDLAELESVLAGTAAREARAELLPTLSLNAQLTRNNNAVELGGSSFTNLWDYSATGVASLQLFRGSAVPAWRAARLREDNTQLDTNEVAAALRASVAAAYVEAWAAVSDRALGDATIELRERSLTAAQDRGAAGYGLDVDVEVAALLLEEARLNRSLADARISDALAVLSRLTGIGSITADSLSAPALDGAAAAPIAEPSAMRSLRGAIDAARLDTRALHLDFLPVLNLEGRYNVGRSSVRAPDGTSWTIALSLNWVLFDDARYARLDASRARAEIATTRLLAYERRRVQETTLAEQRLLDARARVSLRERAVAVRTGARDLVAEQFALGGATIFELISADDAVVAARSALLAAQLDVERAIVDVLYLRGAFDGAASEAR